MFEVYEQGDTRIQTAPTRKPQNKYRGVAIPSDYTESMLVVQATSGSNHAARCTKLEAAEFIALWNGAGVSLED
jgi:hypothetical protein